MLVPVTKTLKSDLIRSLLFQTNVTTSETYHRSTELQDSHELLFSQHQIEQSPIKSAKNGVKRTKKKIVSKQK